MKKSFSYIFCIVTAWLLVSLLCSGCTFLNKLIDRDKDFYVHPVKWEGETLSILSKWYTGSLDNWNAIAKVNPTLDPNRIVIGSEIRIPTGLLITRSPMPKSFLTGFSLEKKVKRPEPETIIRSAPVKTIPQTEPDKKGAQPDIIRPAEIPDQQIPPAVIPHAAPVIKPVPTDMGGKPLLPDKESHPLTAPLPQLEKKQNLSETDRLIERSDKPLSGGASSQPKIENNPPQPKIEPPIEKEELPLFGPKGYSD